MPTMWQYFFVVKVSRKSEQEYALLANNSNYMQAVL